MGGKSKAPKTPNYQPLIDASAKESAYAFQQQQQQQDWARQAYAENKQNADQVIQSSMKSMNDQYANATTDRARYEQTFVPLQDEYISKAKDYASPGRMETEAGKAEADVAAQFGAARQSAQDRLEAYGVDPSSTRAGALDLGTRIAQAAAQSSAGNQARNLTEQTGNQMLLSAIGLGQNLPGQASSEYQGSLSAGNQAVNTGLATTASGAQTMGTGQGWGQVGQGALGQWGGMMDKGFQDQMSAFNANQKSSSGWGSALGAVGGIAAHFLPMAAAEGGVIPPQASPSGGAVTDDIAAQPGPGTPPVQVNAGEFIVPKDVTQWLGEKGIQNLIMKARKEMSSGAQRPAQPTAGPPPGAIPANSVGAIPPQPGQ
jgi:hypothetical protein